MKTFTKRVIEIAREIPKGRVTTYGRIAVAAGAGEKARPGSFRKAGARRREAWRRGFSAEKNSWRIAAQSITGILSKAYDAGAKDIPFHRIVYADGKIWVNAKYRKERMKLYKKEGIEIDKNDRVKNFKDIVLEFN